MKNFIKPGKTMTFTAPAGGVVSGSAYIIGALLVIANNTVAAGLPFEGETEGVFSLPKAGTQAWTEGQAVYWDNTAKVFSSAATAGFYRAGVAAAAVAGGAGDTTGQVRLTGEVTFPVSAAYVAR